MKTFQEPTLEELLADPVIRLVMTSDGFTGAQIRRIAQDARNRLDQPAGADSNKPKAASWRTAPRTEASRCCA